MTRRGFPWAKPLFRRNLGRLRGIGGQPLWPASPDQSTRHGGRGVIAKHTRKRRPFFATSSPSSWCGRWSSRPTSGLRAPPSSERFWRASWSLGSRCVHSKRGCNCRRQVLVSLRGVRAILLRQEIEAVCGFVEKHGKRVCYRNSCRSMIFHFRRHAIARWRQSA